MGRSDPYLGDFYKKNIYLKGDVALLGFVQQGKFGLRGDLYDYQLNNWEINSDWKLPKKYDTIVSLRCPYFAKDPEKFIEKCFENLKEGGVLFLDWGYGHHWTGRDFSYKVGWARDGSHEHAYFDGNFLWSGVWHDSFLNDPEFIKFVETTKMFPAYDNDVKMKEIIFNETPHVLELEKINKKYDIVYNINSLWDINMAADDCKISVSGVNYKVWPPTIGPCKWELSSNRCMPNSGASTLRSSKRDLRMLPQCYILLMMRKKK